MKVLNKIQKVKEVIKKTDLKKAGRNNHSKYEYFTPEQVELLVFENCKTEKLFNKYDLIRAEHGLLATMNVFDLESGESQLYTLAMEIPSITATNISQQIGGAMTYSERYLLMNIYGIKDNNLDFDSHEKKETKEAPKEVKYAIDDNALLTQNYVSSDWNGKIYKGNSVYINKEPVILSEDQIKKLQNHPKYIK